MSGTSEGSNSPNTPLEGGNAKVAIPRLPNETAGLSPLRTPQACTACRVRKAKCDGRRPKCQTCQRLNRVCTYTGSKRDNQRLQLQSLQQKSELYEQLLGDIIAKATVNENISIQNVFKVRHGRISPKKQFPANLLIETF